MDIRRLQFHYFIGLLLIVLAVTIGLFWPFITSLAIAFVAAVIVRPVHRRLLKRLRDKQTLAALIAVFFVLIVILVPLSFIAGQIAFESLNFYNGINQNQNAADFSTIGKYTIHPIQSIFPSFNPDIQGYISSFSDNIVANARTIFSKTAQLAVDLFLAVIALFYMLRDGHRFKKAIIELSPLADTYDREIIEKIEQAVNSVVRGSLLISIIRGAAVAVGLAYFGVPHPILWGAVTGLACLLPGIGLFITLIPAVIYLLALNMPSAAIGLAIWSMISVGLIDNILMPIIMGKGFTVHPLFVLLSILGGLIFFGPVGLLLGPLVVALLSALLEIYKLIVIDHSRGAGSFLH